MNWNNISNTTIANCFKHTGLFEEENQEIKASPEEQAIEQELATVIDQLLIHQPMSINALLNLEEGQ